MVGRPIFPLVHALKLNFHVMRVLHTIPYFNKASGGPVSCTYQLVKGLNRITVDTDIISFLPSPDDLLASDQFITYLPDDRYTPLWLSQNMRRHLKSTIADYDIVHINTIWTWPSHISATQAIHHRKPLIISPHGMLYPQALKVSAWKKRIISNLFVRTDLAKASCIHATSIEEAQHIRNYGVQVPIAVIPNCICVDDYPQPRQEVNTIRRFGFTGRLNPIKNIDILLRAWISLGNLTDGCELTIIGDGDNEYVRSLKEIASLAPAANIKFTGFLSGTTLRDTVNSLDFLILPSKSENFGMVVPEALVCGVPVIASKGTPWQVLDEKKCGWWVDASETELANTIREAITTTENNRRGMGRRGRDLVIENFGSSAVAMKMQHLYQWILRQADKPDFVSCI